MNKNQELVVAYLKENGIIDGLYELENMMECVPVSAGVAYEYLTLLEFYEAIEEAVKHLKEELK